MKIVPLSALRDNYIWALVHGGRCIVVDPGEAAPVQTFLDDNSLSLTAILLTHHHPDHIGGVDSLTRRFPVEVYGPADARIPCVTRGVGEGDAIDIPGFADGFRVLAVPGHTETHIAYLAGDALFCGDTLFSSGCGRLLGGTAEQLHTSLQRLAALPPQTRVFCTHEYTLANLRFALAVEPGNSDIIARQARCLALRETSHPTLPVTMGEELTHNPFLRCAQPAVHQAAEAFAGRHLSSQQEVFAALRRWKDDF